MLELRSIDPWLAPLALVILPATTQPPMTAGPEAVLPVAIADAAFGASGALRTRIVRPGELLSLDLEWQGDLSEDVRYWWRPVLGTPGDGADGVLDRDRARVPVMAGVYELQLAADGVTHDFGERLRVVVTVPFERKRNGRIGRYHMGTWPTEGAGRTDAYAPPPGFVEVTEDNRYLRLSQHLTVGDFVTHDQADVWPKYVAVDPRLIDKLELVIQELRAMGVQADRMVVMSGFRTPQYNRYRLNNPPSSLSRHQFGDAADVWIDNEGDRYMSDLNGDGRRDLQDARVMLEAVERVERRHPELVGGVGVYRANRVRGPFIHIDVRGARARW